MRVLRDVLHAMIALPLEKSFRCPFNSWLGPRAVLGLVWNLHNKSHAVPVSVVTVGRDSSVGIATRYGMDGRGIESRWGRDFQHPSRPALGPTQPPVQWVPGHSRG
jgi:hypothetical protein